MRKPFLDWKLSLLMEKRLVCVYHLMLLNGIINTVIIVPGREKS